MLFAPFDWLYRKLGPRYPKLFVAWELQAGFFVTAGTIVLLASYYHRSFHDFAVLMAIALGLTGITIVFGLVRILPRLDPIRAWIGGERDDASTEAAWVAAVGLPLALVKDELLVPVLGVVVPSAAVGVVMLDLPWLGFFPLLAAGMVATGYGAILHHLTLEIGMRPVLVDINRAASPHLASRVEALPLKWRLLAVLPMINVITGLTVAAVSGADSLGIAIVAAIGVATTISLELTLLLTRSVMQPLHDLQKATTAVSRGDFNAAVPVTTADEFGELAASFNEMVTGLRERDRIRQAFGTYLDHEVAEHILSEGFSEQGEEVEVSILFCDVKDFSGFAESADATEVVACLNELFEVIVAVIASEGGHVDNFEGDGLMAVFGAPQTFFDHADRAVRAATEIDRRVNRMEEGGRLEVGVGVNTGRVVAGSVGGAGRLNFSVIGDAVNVASRVEAATRTLRDDVLITAATRERLHSDFALERKGEHELRGLERPVTLFSLPGEHVEWRPPDPVGGAVRAVYARVRASRSDD